MSVRICLIVDDEPVIRSYLRGILDQEKMQCLEAANAEQALTITHRIGGRIDLIVSDVRIPGGGLSGIDLAHQVHSAYPSIPIILITGYPEDEGTKSAAQVFPFIRKPFLPE